MTDAQAEQEQEHCPNCTRFGLPILPVRYAVAWNKDDIVSKAPPLAAPFGQGVQEIALPGDAGRYTLRLLRSGYLYVFNEVRGEWKAYQVSDSSELTEFDIRDRTPPAAEEDEPSATCSRHGSVPLAGCVVIPDAANAGRVWFAFSGTAWTPAVLARHRTEEWRKRHMHCIDVKAWMAGGGNATQPHVDALAKIRERVSEYHFPAPQPSSPNEVIVVAYRAFLHALSGLRNLSGQAEGLIAAARQAGAQWGYPPAMIAVADPVGVTMELARLIATDLEDEIDAQREARPLAISSAIRNIRQAIHDDAENRQVYRSEREARQILDPGFMAGGDGGAGARAGMALAEAFNPRLRQQREELFERWRNPTPAQMAQARTDAWQRYERKYDKRRLETWERSWNDRMSAYDQRITSPLARAHARWLESASLCEHLECNHDDGDVHSGKGFVDALLLCIQDTQQYKPCMNVYSRWLSATRIEKNNLVLRALGYNQKAVIDRLNSVAQGGLEPSSLRGLPWDGMINGYDQALTALGNGGKNAVVRLTAALGGAFAAVAGKAVDGVIGPGLVALGLIARAPVVMVDVTMSKANAIAQLTARMAALNPEVAGLSDLNRAIDIQMRKARIYGSPVHGTGKFRYLIMADPQVVLDFPGVDAQGNARRFAESALLTEADRRQLTQLRWRRLLPGSAGLGLATGILQAVALGKLAEDVDKSMAHELNENRWRYSAGTAALAGTLAETVGKWTESASTAGSRLAVFIERHVGKAMRVIGKGIGIGAGVIMAVWDSIRGIQEINEGNAWVGALYIGSAFGAVVALVAFSKLGALIFGAAATGVGIVLVILVIVIAVLIEIFKDNKVQDWMERCYFGVFDSRDRYSDPERELKELEIALAG